MSMYLFEPELQVLSVASVQEALSKIRELNINIYTENRMNDYAPAYWRFHSFYPETKECLIYKKERY